MLSGMDWEELGKGLAGVSALMLIMAAGAKLLNGSGMVRAGAGMILVAVGINILAGAVKLFSTMSWSEMGQGTCWCSRRSCCHCFGMQLMPKGLALQGVGLLLVATSLNILAGAIMLFATMDWGEMGKGLVGIGGALLIIGLAMHLMPATMPIIGAGLLLVSVSLIAIATAMKMIAGLSWEEIAKGMVGIAGSLIILGVAMHAMQSAILGAVAIGIAAGSLVDIGHGVEGICWSELGRSTQGSRWYRCYSSRSCYICDAHTARYSSIACSRRCFACHWCRIRVIWLRSQSRSQSVRDTHQDWSGRCKDDYCFNGGYWQIHSGTCQGIC